jgi:AcrR family transcriptional regulator
MNHGSESEGAHQKLRDRVREATAQAILTAAEELFADAGLHAARMDEIAARAGVSVGTLYNYFEDREALLAGLLEARQRELIGAVDAAVAAGAGRPFVERLRGLLFVLLDHCEGHRKFLHIALQREVALAKTERAARRKEDTMRELHSRIDKLMKQGAAQGALRPETADLAPVFLMGMMRALVIRSVILDDRRGLLAEVDRLLDGFLHGLGGKGV